MAELHREYTAIIVTVRPWGCELRLVPAGEAAFLDNVQNAAWREAEETPVIGATIHVVVLDVDVDPVRVSSLLGDFEVAAGLRAMRCAVAGEEGLSEAAPVVGESRAAVPADATDDEVVVPHLRARGLSTVLSAIIFAKYRGVGLTDDTETVVENPSWRGVVEAHAGIHDALEQTAEPDR